MQDSPQGADNRVKGPMGGWDQSALKFHSQAPIPHPLLRSPNITAAGLLLALLNAK